MNFSLTTGTAAAATATVTLHVAGVTREGTAQRTGAVDAALRAIEAAAKSGAELQALSLKPITGSTHGTAEVSVRLQKGGRIVTGISEDLDLLTACVRAYLDALNRLARGHS